MSFPSRSKPTIVSTVLRPIVMIATANTGLPTIGRNAPRSRSRPMEIARIPPSTRATQKLNPQAGPV